MATSARAPLVQGARQRGERAKNRGVQASQSGQDQGSDMQDEQPKEAVLFAVLSSAKGSFFCTDVHCL